MELLDRLGLMPGSFAVRVAVVSGATRSIGEQVARTLARLDAHMVILDIRPTGEAVAARIVGAGGRAEFIQVDLTDLQALDAVQREVFTRHGAVDILINNASKLRACRSWSRLSRFGTNFIVRPFGPLPL